MNSIEGTLFEEDTDDGVKVGDRVGCISHDDGDTIYFFGFGTYLGRRLPAEAAGFHAELNMAMFENRCEAAKEQCDVRGADFEKVKVDLEQVFANPVILLDNGDTVFGCECWWGPIEMVQAKLDEFAKRIRVNISTQRSEYEGKRRERVLAVEGEWSYVERDGTRMFMCSNPQADPADCPSGLLMQKAAKETVQ